MRPRILIVATYYPEFLSELYAEDASLAELPFDRQRERLFSTAFGVGDAYSWGLRALGCEAQEIVCNADAMQERWAADHGLKLTENIHDRRRQIVAAQIDHIRPDVLFVFEWCPLGDAFLTEMKSRVRVLVGQIASPLPDNRTFAAYDLMLSSYPPIVDHFRSVGIDAKPLRLAFDQRILERLEVKPPLYDVTFVGGFAPSHGTRIAWLEGLLENLNIDVFGYGLEQTPEASSIRHHHRGPAWGWEMYEVLRRSRVTLNLHSSITIGGQVVSDFANNMRLYEATGVGTCLVTENRSNLHQMFAAGSDVVTYDKIEDCVGAVRHLLNNHEQRTEIAQAGQQRTLKEHTYDVRMKELLELLQARL